jgi:hypothetical protein
LKRRGRKKWRGREKREGEEDEGRGREEGNSYICTESVTGPLIIAFFFVITPN